MTVSLPTLKKVSLPSMSRYVTRPKAAKLTRRKATEETVQEGIITRLPEVGRRFEIGNEGWSTSAVTEIDELQLGVVYKIKTLYAEYLLEVFN